MAIYEISKNGLKRLDETDFLNEGIYERRDLQQFLKQDISVLGDNLLVIAEEFSQWEGSSRRIDLFCIDAEANLVIIELKRTDDGGHMDLQAIRYAAMISKMTFEELVRIYSDFNKFSVDEAKKNILDFLKCENELDIEFGSETKIILAAADFSKELTTSVMWLNEFGLDIRCVRMKPYKTSDEKLMLDVQQIIPLQEAAQYQMQIREKQQSEKKHNSKRKVVLLKFWTELLSYASSRTKLHANRKAGAEHWIGGSIGKKGLALTYVTRKNDSHVELCIDFGDKIENLNFFNQLESNKEKIEQNFSASLKWEQSEKSRVFHISYPVNGGYCSAESEWYEIHGNLVDAMIRLDGVMRPYVKT